MTFSLPKRLNSSLAAAKGASLGLYIHKAAMNNKPTHFSPLYSSNKSEPSMKTHIVLLLCWLLVMSYLSPPARGMDNITTQNNTISCISEERDALLQFKHGIQVDECGLLVSWEGHDCCRWQGVHCNNHTGHVIGLHLRGIITSNDSSELCLQGEVSPSLLQLKQLEYLDLSMNNFQDQSIPSFIGSLLNLKRLNLSSSGFQGEVPHQLGNLSKLVSLDLTSSDDCLNCQYAKGLGWLSRLTLLREVDLSGVDLSQATDFFQVVNNLPFLVVLHAENCGLSSPILRSLSHANTSAALSVVSLARNEFNDSSIFQWLFNLSLISTRLEHVDLSRNSLLDPIPSAFGYKMKALSYLDLSFNQLGGSIPSSFGNMKGISYLCLSYNQLGGPIPSTLGNMSSLSYLDLSNNQHGGPIPSSFGDMHALSELHLSYNQLEGPIPSAFGDMNALSYLDLSFNQLEGPIPSTFGNMHALRYLYLFDNQLEGPFPVTISNLKHLYYLDLSSNHFQGSGNLPKILGSLCSLQTLILHDNNMTDDFSTIIHALSAGCAHKSLVSLDLSNTRVWGSIPDRIGAFSSLRELFVSDNQLNGTISPRLGQLSLLERLDVSNNFFQGTLSSHHFSNLSRLAYLFMSSNPDLVVHINSNWIPPFQLNSVYMSSCKVGPQFPKWLLTQKHYWHLDISNTGISDTIPPSFWNSLPSELSNLNMSYNKISGVLPADITSNVFPSVPEIDLSSNLLEGTIQSFGESVSLLYLNNNMFTNAIPLLCPKTKVMISSLDLSNNMLSHKLPDCWEKFAHLTILRLENNHFSGKLPSSIGSLRQLNLLHLRNNSFAGELPTSLENCTSLSIFDAGLNFLTGYIPPRIGNIFKSIVILNLRSNNFYGRLPISLCELSYLQILDLSGNRISGAIPDCVSNLTAMVNSTDFLPQVTYDIQYNSTSDYEYKDTAIVMWKGKEQSFKNNLGLVKSIDLSHNKLEGHIPSRISSLRALVSLDLSGNNLIGSITPDIGELGSLELLDLSNNHLSGRIPPSLANLHSLSVLDLSNNSLSGKIPSSTQLQSFTTLSYMGNPQLCGPPLPICPGDQPPAQAHAGTQNVNVDKDDDIFPGLYISAILGFIIGFWGVCGTLVIRRSWRVACFRLVDDIIDRIRRKP